MLERKRRARINRCLDELKELMVTTLQAEGENVNKLEKADILELTVRHLHKLSKTTDQDNGQDHFQAGFNQCAMEVTTFLGASPNPQLLRQLDTCLNTVDLPERPHVWRPW